MNKLGRRALAASSFVAVFGGAVIACNSTLNLDLAGILAGQSGAACTNSTPDAGADAGGCNSGFLCFNTYCVETGALRVSLSFTADTDLDLHVISPQGGEIYFGNREQDHGKLDVDQCVSSCGGGDHVENVFFDSSAAQGVYTIYVVNYTGRSAATFNIDVVANEQTQTFMGSVNGTDKAESTRFMYSYPPPAPTVEAGTTDDASSGSDAGGD